MTIQTSYLEAYKSFDTLLDTVADDREVVIIERPGAEDIVLIAADELRSLFETVHLLRSPANAERLLTALARVRRGEGQAQTLDALRREVAIDKAPAPGCSSLEASFSLFKAPKSASLEDIETDISGI
jgi:antitoxin YefM